MENPENKPLNDFLKVIDKAHPELQRTAIQIGTTEDGEPLGIIVWKRARHEKGQEHTQTGVCAQVLHGQRTARPDL